MIDIPTPAELRTERKDADLSQSELADRVGISQPALSQIESGNNDPTLSTVRKIALEINKAQS
jgi:predicted transcriptional regulator